MPVREQIEISSSGDEGRFLEWDGTSWRAYEHYNYRHHFEELPVTEHDLTVLREQFGVGNIEISRSDLVNMAPEKIRLAKTDK